MIKGWNDIWSGWWFIDRFVIAYGIFLIIFIGMLQYDLWSRGREDCKPKPKPKIPGPWSRK